MQATIFTEILLPLVLAIVMFGMGLSLTRADFSRLSKTPKSAIIGLIGQLLVLPLLAFAIAIALSAPIEIAIGMMILAACPGGTTSNLISHVAKANLALSVSLTAITTVVCVFTTPWLIALSISYFTQAPIAHFSLFKTSLGLLLISLLPVYLGMWLRAKSPGLANNSEAYFRHFSTIFMILLIAVIAYQEFEMLVNAFPDVFILAFSLNISATIVGILLASLFALNNQDKLTLGIEIGTQNSSMAILIAVSFLQQPSYAIAAGVYGVTMYICAFALVALSKKLLPRSV